MTKDKNMKTQKQNKTQTSPVIFVYQLVNPNKLTKEMKRQISFLLQETKTQKGSFGQLDTNGVVLLVNRQGVMNGVSLPEDILEWDGNDEPVYDKA